MQGRIKVVKEGTILPARYFSAVFDWGIGGVLDEDGEFVEESGMEVMHRFGGKYEYDEAECDYLEETVVYVGLIRNHWGHFLAECSARFWYLLKEQTDYKVAFCGFWEGEFSPKLIEIFGFLGVGKDRMLDIRKPTKFKRILIPSPALTYEPYNVMPGKTEDFFANWGKHNCNWNYTDEFKEIFEGIVQKAMPKTYAAAEKIYYTRTGLNRKKEIGEDLIEKIFFKNGYMIVSPEKESVETQIMLMNSCKRFVSMEGTLAHNIVFTAQGEQLRQLILCKQIWKNALQNRLNKCMGVAAESIYVGCRPFGKKFPCGGWDGIYWLRPGRELKKWCQENDMWFPGPFEIFAADVKNLFAYIRLCGEEMRGDAKTWKEDSRVLKRVRNYKNIVLYGINSRCLRLKHRIERKYPQKQVYLADTNAGAIRKYIEVYGMDDAAALQECACLIGITNRAAAEEVKREMLKKGMEEKAVYLF